jgi:hypothetical protein
MRPHAAPPTPRSVPPHPPPTPFPKVDSLSLILYENIICTGLLNKFAIDAV